MVSSAIWKRTCTSEFFRDHFIIIIIILLKFYLHTVFSSGFNMQQTKLDKYKSRTTLNRKYNTCFS